MRWSTVAFVLGCCVQRATAEITWGDCPEDVYANIGLSTSGRRLESVELDELPRYNSHLKIKSLRDLLKVPKEIKPIEPSRARILEARQHLRGLLDEGTLELHCGRKEVPENPDVGNSKSIGVSVYRLRTRTRPENGRTHYWALQGGPGASGLSLLFVMSEAISNGFGDAIYIPDHRGTGRSTNLRCDDQVFDDDSLNIDDREINQCFQSIKNNLDVEPKSFGVTEAAADVISLIKDEKEADQPDQVRLHGFSYGTMWAQRMLQLEGGVVDQVVLEGVVSDVLEFNKFALGSQIAGDLFMKRCQQDSKCNAAYPDGADTLLDFADVSNQCTNALWGDGPSQWLAQTLLYQGLVFGRVQDTNGNTIVDVRAFMLAVLHRIKRCQGSDLKVATRMIYFLISNAAEPSTEEPSLEEVRTALMEYQTNLAIYHLIRYSELWDDGFTLADAESALQNVMWGSTNMEEDYELADVFDNSGLEYADTTIQTEFYAKDVPADILIINGEIDGQTPYTSALDAFAKMTVAPGKSLKLAIIPSDGHSPSQNACGRETVTNFFAGGSLPNCAMDQSNNPQVDGYSPKDTDLPSDVGLRIAGTSDIWDGPYTECSNIELGADTCDRNIRVCDACYKACITTVGECSCGALLATCLNRIGCTQNYCTKSLVDVGCTESDCVVQRSSSITLVIGAVAGVVVAVLCVIVLFKSIAKGDNSSALGEEKEVIPTAAPAVAEPVLSQEDENK